MPVVPAHLNPRALQHVCAADLVEQRMADPASSHPARQAPGSQTAATPPPPGTGKHSGSQSRNVADRGAPLITHRYIYFAGTLLPPQAAPEGQDLHLPRSTASTEIYLHQPRSPRSWRTFRSELPPDRGRIGYKRSGHAGEAKEVGSGGEGAVRIVRETGKPIARWPAT